jgi:hypothetical protein
MNVTVESFASSTDDWMGQIPAHRCLGEACFGRGSHTANKVGPQELQQQRSSSAAALWGDWEHLVANFGNGKFPQTGKQPMSKRAVIQRQASRQSASPPFSSPQTHQSLSIWLSEQQLERTVPEKRGKYIFVT